MFLKRKKKERKKEEERGRKHKRNQGQHKISHSVDKKRQYTVILCTIHEFTTWSFVLQNQSHLSYQITCEIKTMIHDFMLCVARI